MGEKILAQRVAQNNSCIALINFFPYEKIKDENLPKKKALHGKCEPRKILAI